ncbi:M15 family metallopeptidase [Rufibacter sp. LB8]|uniref:M15 family metallopeptidase n=1 Tax=Rufibacter sp. LB8 TaxID=2777781 RepID=UPI00178C2B2C|nr:M15 family metallopeptidase [Rufibacter sp. LB8]
MKHFALTLLFALLSSFGWAQQTPLPAIPKGPYGLPIVTSVELYRQQVAANPNHELVELAMYIPGLVLDIKYATADNLVGEPVYKTATAFARKPVADALKKIQADLQPLGLGLKIFDGYRPYQVTVHFYEKIKDTVYVASPRNGSKHNRGCAMDVTLVRLKDGKELEMPTAYDATIPQSHAEYANVPRRVKKNRELLKKMMHKHGFKVYAEEWWHYDFNDWRNYPLMDIPFEVLQTGK